MHVRAHRPDAAHLELHYHLSGDCHAVVLPSRQAAPAPADGLWQHTCMEAFIADGQGASYHEFNFSPAGDWAVYAFAAPRQRSGNPGPDLIPAITTQASASALQVRVATPLPAVVQGQAEPALGLSAVVAHHDGTHSYWALAHPCDHPDFHARASWLATLPPAPASHD